MKRFSLTDFFRQHMEAGQRALREIIRYPLNSILTIMAIGLALSLPGLLLSVLENSQKTIQPWQDGRQINVFLKLNVTDDRLSELISVWEEDGEVDQIKLISREQALAEFKQQSGLADALDLLEENPLPAVLIVAPAENVNTADKIQSLGNRISADPAVDAVQIDQDWLQRLQDFFTFLQTTTWLLALMFGLMVALVINNSLRSEILRRQNEVEVIKLIGGSNDFIQRPFLYTAILLGISGALFAIIIILIIFSFLSPHLEALLQHYTDTDSPLHLGPKTTILIPLAGILLSLVSTIVAIRINIRQIEPQ